MSSNAATKEVSGRPPSLLSNDRTPPKATFPDGLVRDQCHWSAPSSRSAPVASAGHRRRPAMRRGAPMGPGDPPQFVARSPNRVAPSCGRKTLPGQREARTAGRIPGASRCRSHYGRVDATVTSAGALEAGTIAWDAKPNEVQPNAPCRRSRVRHMPGRAVLESRRRRGSA